MLVGKNLTDTGETISVLKRHFPDRPEIEFFCSLSEVEGWDKKANALLKSFSLREKYQSTRLDYYADLAEVKASFILGDRLGLEIFGFEVIRNSQNSSTSQRNCDIGAYSQNSKLFFEVKARSIEEIQTAPHALEENLKQWLLTVDYAVALKVHQRMNKATDFDNIGRLLNEFLEAFPGMDSYEDCRGFSIRVLPKSGKCSNYVEVFEGEPTNDLVKWLFLDKERDGKDIKSKVTQAIGKRADFLMALIPPQDEEEWSDLVRRCFPGVTFDRFKPVVSSNSRLQGLLGMILFTSEDEFQIILKKGVDWPFPVKITPK